MVFSDARVTRSPDLICSITFATSGTLAMDDEVGDCEVEVFEEEAASD